MNTLLQGHVSPQTAYIVEDYPYGFRLRCRKRYWIEYKEGHGYREVSQTSNPKCPDISWNKPKAGVYCPLLILYLNTEGHVQTMPLRSYGSREEFEAFQAIANGKLTGEEANRADALLACARKQWK